MFSGRRPQEGCSPCGLCCVLARSLGNSFDLVFSCNRLEKEVGQPSWNLPSLQFSSQPIPWVSIDLLESPKEGNLQSALGSALRNRGAVRSVLRFLRKEEQHELSSETSRHFQWQLPRFRRKFHGVDGDTFSIKAPKECSKKFAATLKGKFLTRRNLLRIVVLFLEDLGAPL